MPEGNNFHSLAAEFFAACGAIDDFFIRAARRAGRSRLILFDRLARRMTKRFYLFRLLLAAGTDPLTQALFGASRLGDNFPITETMRVFGLIACRKHRKPANRKRGRKQ